METTQRPENGANRTGWETQALSSRLRLLVSPAHSFCTDTILLANFSMPKPGELCADLGTGCGAIPMLWAERGEPARIYGVEIQDEAVELARENVRHNKLSEKIKILHTDLRDWSDLRGGLEKNEVGNFHLVACNPPYTAPGGGIISINAAQAAARHESCCSLEDVAAAAERLLRWGGRFCFCMRPDRLTEAVELCRRHGMESKRLQLVQQRPGKAPFLFMMQAVRGGRPGLKVEPVLFIESPIHTGHARLSKEILSIYGDYKKGHAQ